MWSLKVENSVNLLMELPIDLSTEIKGRESKAMGCWPLVPPFLSLHCGPAVLSGWRQTSVLSLGPGRRGQESQASHCPRFYCPL